MEHEMSCSAATREKLRQAALRQWAQPEIRQRMRDAMQGGHHSAEARERHRQAYFRNPISAETRKKMQESQRERYARLRAQGLLTWSRSCIDCGKASRGLRCRACFIKWNRGANHPVWKGTRINFQGYVDIRVNGRRQAMHRLIWEEAYGPIPEGHVIHHLNGDRADNRLENLELMTSAQHGKLHRNEFLCPSEARL